MQYTHYKCEFCENVFLKEEAATHYEYGEFDACPKCKQIHLKEVNLCENEDCKSVLTDDERGSGLCEKCLMKLVNYEIGYKYIIHNKELPYFIFLMIFDCPEPPQVNELLMNELQMIFQRKKVEDFLYNKPFLLNKIKEYIKYDLCHFYEFLKKEGGEIDEQTQGR